VLWPKNTNAIIGNMGTTEPEHDWNSSEFNYTYEFS
jgi:hypothetical protein